MLSANRTKAGELLRQCEEIASASNLEGLRFRRTPWPGSITAVDGGATAEIEGAGWASGHAAGYDIAIVDEIGLLLERHRPQVQGMRSFVSARDGRFLSISIHGGGPFVDEILARRGDPELAIHHYRGDPDLPLAACGESRRFGVDPSPHGVVDLTAWRWAKSRRRGRDPRCG